MNTIIKTAAIAGAGLLLAVGCSNDEEGRGDAPVGERHEAPRQVINMPDSFPNLAIACDGTTAIMVTTRTNPVVIPNSQYCGGVDE